MANMSMIDELSHEQNNLDIYNRLRTPPPEALKTIKGGRLSGMTDINPMWRIKAMTEVFGSCGVGWKYEIVRLWTEPGPAGEMAAFAQISLYYQEQGGWSAPIPGIGGSMLVANETKGLYVSDECYKMAVTDAISVACKALGAAADIYWDKDRSKYDAPPIIPEEGPVSCKRCGKPVKDVPKKSGELVAARNFAVNSGGLCYDCWREAQEK